MAQRVVIPVLGDITRQSVDAVVNAANERLAGGGGVDGAIHRAAGPAALHQACAALGGCPPGDARITPGFALPARWIVHTVGPRWRGGGHGELDVLASCYRRSLAVAASVGARSIAFPAIGTGAFGVPPDLAAAVAVAVATVTAPEEADGVPTDPDYSIVEVRLVAFDEATFERYHQALADLATASGTAAATGPASTT